MFMNFIDYMHPVVDSIHRDFNATGYKFTAILDLTRSILAVLRTVTGNTRGHTKHSLK